MSPAEFEPASHRPQNLALGRSAAGIGGVMVYKRILNKYGRGLDICFANKGTTFREASRTAVKMPALHE